MTSDSVARKESQCSLSGFSEIAQLTRDTFGSGASCFCREKTNNKNWGKVMSTAMILGCVSLGSEGALVWLFLLAAVMAVKVVAVGGVIAGISESDTSSNTPLANDRRSRPPRKPQANRDASRLAASFQHPAGRSGQGSRTSESAVCMVCG